eukprot:3501352-Pleurochrysis_carterae.AAC.2
MVFAHSGRSEPFVFGSSRRRTVSPLIWSGLDASRHRVHTHASFVVTALFGSHCAADVPAQASRSERC